MIHVVLTILVSLQPQRETPNPLSDEQRSRIASIRQMMASQPEERRDIAVGLFNSLLLNESDSIESRRAMCEVISLFGGDDHVGNLAALLLERDLADAARNALERIGTDKAKYALRQALENVEGDQRRGIIASLGRLGDTEAVALIEPTDDVSIGALANIGGLGAFRKIEPLLAEVDARAKSGERGPHDAMVVDAALRIAPGVHGKLETLAILDGAHHEPWVRAAARRTLVDHGRKADRLISLFGEDRGLALQIVRTTPATPVVEDLAARFDELERDDQVAVLDALRERHAPVVSAEILGLLESEDADLRHAAMRLGANDPTFLPMLLNAAISGGDDAAVAKRSLLQARGPTVDDALAAATADRRAPVRDLALEVMAMRRSDVPVTILFPLLDDSVSSARALRTMGAIADADDVEALCERYASNRRADLRRVIERLAGTPEGGARLLEVYRASSSKEALVDLLPAVGGEDAFALLESSTNEDAKRKGVLAWPDGAALDRLRAMVGQNVDGAHAAYLRVLRAVGGTESDFRFALDLSRTSEERADALRSLGAVPSKETLELALRMLADDDVKFAAADAVIAIAPQVEPSMKEDAIAALHRIMVIGLSQEQLVAAGRAANVVERDDDYILSWFVAGPFEAEGRNGSALFDHEFLVEREPDAVEWSKMPTEQQRDPRAINLQEIGAGDNRCAYLRTKIHVDRPQPVRLEFGSDDGFKAWLNGSEIASENAMRGWAPGQNTGTSSLEPGWNTLVMKITNGGGDWQASCRIRRLDGFSVEGLRVMGN